MHLSKINPLLMPNVGTRNRTLLMNVILFMIYEIMGCLVGNHDYDTTKITREL